MPTYNQAQWLPGALASVLAMDHDGVCVVDDGSTDATPKVIATFARAYPDDFWTVESRKNEGTAGAINRGVDTFSAHVEALTWCSSDNVMHECALGILSDQIADGAGVAYGGFWHCTPERVQYLFKPYDPARLIADVNCYFGPAFLIRKDVWLEAGPHRGKISHDYDHWLRVEEVCWKRGLPIVGVDYPLCWYNAHDKRVTVTRAHEFDAHHWQAEARKRRGLG
jgi:glycosyltransferase involved in cell wall biosynthesis